VASFCAARPATPYFSFWLYFFFALSQAPAPELRESRFFCHELAFDFARLKKTRRLFDLEQAVGLLFFSLAYWHLEVSSFFHSFSRGHSPLNYFHTASSKMNGPPRRRSNTPTTFSTIPAITYRPAEISANLLE